MLPVVGLLDDMMILRTKKPTTVLVADADVDNPKRAVLAMVTPIKVNPKMIRPPTVYARPARTNAIARNFVERNGSLPVWQPWPPFMQPKRCIPPSKLEIRERSKSQRARCLRRKLGRNKTLLDGKMQLLLVLRLWVSRVPMANGTKWSNSEQSTRNNKKSEKNVTESDSSEPKRHKQEASIRGRRSIHMMVGNMGNRGMAMEMGRTAIEARVSEGEDAATLMTDETTADDGTT